jgi:hypothetical protein
VVNNCSDYRSALIVPAAQNAGVPEGTPPKAAIRLEVPVDEIVSRLSRVLEPTLHATAKRAAAREHELTREWLESKGLPKAARVAQRETYNVLRRYGMINESTRTHPANAGICRHEPGTGPRPLTSEEVEELAQACIAMLETQGQAIEHTIAEMDSEKGGFLLPNDVVRVRQRATALLTCGNVG